MELVIYNVIVSILINLKGFMGWCIFYHFISSVILGIFLIDEKKMYTGSKLLTSTGSFVVLYFFIPDRMGILGIIKSSDIINLLGG